MARDDMARSATQVLSVFKADDATHRQHRRARVDEVLVRFRVGDQQILAKVADISAGGLFAKTTNPVPPGAFLELVLVQPGRSEATLHGIVVDDIAHRAGMAVRFTGVPEQARNEIARLLQHGSTDEGEAVSPLEPATQPPAGEPIPPAALQDLRRQVRELETENQVLRERAQWADQAERVIGRLQLEVERLRSRGPDDMDQQTMLSLRSDAEGAFQAMKSVLERLDKLR
jgi:hypothetical protein